MTPIQAALLQPQQPAPVSQLSLGDYTAAATALACEIAAIQAVAHVETGYAGAFDEQGRPTVLYEQRYFSRLTNHAYDASHPTISSMAPGGYGRLCDQYPKIDGAAALDFDAALRSASWGAFQIMGDNFTCLKFNSVEQMVSAMRSGIGAHLQAFVQFIAGNPALLGAIQSKNWATFAMHYNGPDYKASGYDGKLAAAYAAAIAQPRVIAATQGLSGSGANS